MAVGENLYYSKVLTLAKGRVLLVPPEDSVKLGNTDDGVDDLDCVNVRQLRRTVSDITGLTNLTQGPGILIDKTTTPGTPILSVDLQYIQDNLTFPQTLSNGLGISPIGVDNLINVDLSLYVTDSSQNLIAGQLDADYGVFINSNSQVSVGLITSGGEGELNILPSETRIVHSFEGNSRSVHLTNEGILLQGPLVTLDSDATQISHLAGIGDRPVYADSTGNLKIGAVGEGFMHLTGSINETADGNKTFTGVTQADFFVTNRIYSTGGFTPNTKFYNSLADGGTSFSIVGPVGSNNTNYLEVIGTLSGSNPVFLVQGIDTNIGINLTPKGTGTVNITTLTGTGSRVGLISPTGQIGTIANTTDGYVLTLVSGVPTWAAASGGGGGGTDVTIGTFGSAPDAKAATINGAGQVLTIQPADATHPGAVSLVAQTLGAGDKTFTDNIIMGSTKSIKNAAGTQFLSIDAGGFINLQGSANTVIRGGGTTSQLTLSSSAAIINSPAITLASTSTVNITAATGQALNFGTTGNTGQTTGDISFMNLRPVFLKSVGTATAALSQRGSSVLNFESSLFNGTTGVLKNFTLSANASTTVNSLTNLVTTYDGTTLFTQTQTGDFILNNSAAALYFGPDGVDGSWRIIRTGTDLDIQRREGGVWSSKSPIPA